MCKNKSNFQKKLSLFHRSAFWASSKTSVNNRGKNTFGPSWSCREFLTLQSVSRQSQNTHQPKTKKTCLRPDHTCLLCNVLQWSRSCAKTPSVRHDTNKKNHVCETKEALFPMVTSSRCFPTATALTCLTATNPLLIWAAAALTTVRGGSLTYQSVCVLCGMCVCLHV